MKPTAGNLKLGAGLAALIGAGVWFAGSPATNRASILRERIDRTRNELRVSQDSVRDIRTMADTLEQARVFAASSTKPLTHTDETSTLVYEISSFVRTLGIVQHELRQERSRVEEGVRVTPVVLTMESSYPDVLAVIERINTLDRLLRVSRLSIDLPRGSMPGATSLQVEIVIEAMSRESQHPAVAAAGEGGSR